MLLRKHLPFVLMLAVLCLACCACTSSLTRVPQKNFPDETGKYENDVYTVTVPQELTLQEIIGDGSVVFLLDGKEVGGISAVPYANADQLSLDAFGEGDEEAADALHDTLKDFVTLLAPGDQSPDYMFSDGSYGSFAVDIVNEDGTNSIMHELFPAGDQFYDVFFEEVSDVTPEQKEAVWSSFTLNP